MNKLSEKYQPIDNRTFQILLPQVLELLLYLGISTTVLSTITSCSNTSTMSSRASYETPSQNGNLDDSTTESTTNTMELNTDNIIPKYTTVDDLCVSIKEHIIGTSTLSGDQIKVSSDITNGSDWTLINCRVSFHVGLLGNESDFNIPKILKAYEENMDRTIMLNDNEYNYWSRLGNMGLTDEIVTFVYRKNTFGWSDISPK
jgi:hypothetical protein